MKTLLVAVAVTLLLTSRALPARACGGFFCDRPPPDGSLPIAQAAENVLFMLDHDPQTGEGRVEAHIQIVYQGAASQFSWVVPVTALPTVDVGTDLLFDRLEPATRPSFALSWQMDGSCQGLGGGSSGGSGCGSASTIANGAAGFGSPSADHSTVDVLFRGDVGPYDTAIIRSDDPTALKTWLTTNGYYVSGEASLIVDQYVAAHDFFVALRLQQGQETSAIRPIVLRMAANEGCLPLKLTAIAATPDVRINVWVLGDARAVPLNYIEVGVNLAKLDWFGFGKNYDQLLRQAADEAGGNAFAVEYAQPAGMLGQAFVVPNGLVSILAQASDPASFVRLLSSGGFPPQGQVLSVLRKDIPMPAALAAQGVTEAQFYGSPYLYLPLAQPMDPPFDPAATTTDLIAAVFMPLEALRPLFTTHAYLTRLATFISPEEMTKDPLFVTNPTLPDVSAKHAAIAHLLCGDQELDVCHAPVRLHLEDGRDVMYAVASGAPATCNAQVTPTYDRADLETLPSADTGWIRDASEGGQLVLDQRPAIAAALLQHNASVSAGAGGVGGGGGGCGCSVRGRSHRLGIALALTALVAIGSRRRRGR
jgi:MYXO-CTERM domain-containing protein